MIKRAFLPAALLAALLGAAPAFAIATTATARTAPQPAVQPTQTFTGTGSGSYDRSFRDEPTYAGRYSSTGQLGSGTFVVDTGLHASATFTRSGARSLTGSVTETPFGCGPFDQFASCYRVDVAGTADVVRAVIQIQARLGTTPVGLPTAATFELTGTLTLDHRIGYAMVGRTGTVYAFGGIDHLGDARTAADATDIERTPSGNGYWIVDSAGHVYAFGDARYLGNAAPESFAPGERVTSMTATPSGLGYWLFTSRGRAITFGDAQFFGDLRAVALNGGIVGSVATPAGAGYYMVGSDGGVFAFGDARFRGSMGGAHLNQPVVGLVPTPDNTGYWLVAADGGVFSFQAPFAGSMGAVRLNRPIVTMLPYGPAYLMIADDGGLFDFSPLPFFGSRGGAALPAPIVGGAAAG